MFKKLAQVPDQVTALLVHSLLEEEGIQVLELQDAAHASLAGTNTTYMIKVAEEEVERATSVLKNNQFGKWILE
jgi:uncharacterized protein YaaQ